MGETVTDPRVLEKRKRRLTKTDSHNSSSIAKFPRDHTTTTSTTLGSDQGDEDCKIIEEEKIHVAAIVKKEHNTASPGTTQLSSESMAKTTFLVTASNQPTLAAVIVPYTSCSAFDRLFDMLIAECGLRPEAAKKVSNISVKNTWDGKNVRIRKGRPEDWEYFNRGLCRAWQHEKEHFEHGCDVEIMIHVED